MAAVSQAASIDWTVGNFAWTLSDGSNPAKNTMVYLINGTTSLDTIAAAVAGGASAITGADWFFGSTATSNTKGFIAKQEVPSSNLKAGTAYDFSVLVVDGDKYMVSDTFNQTAYTPGVDEALGVSFTASLMNANSQTATLSGSVNGWATAVPEPTSGILLLVGGTFLAFRRKRK